MIGDSVFVSAPTKMRNLPILYTMGRLRILHFGGRRNKQQGPILEETAEQKMLKKVRTKMYLVFEVLG